MVGSCLVTEKILYREKKKIYRRGNLTDWDICPTINQTGRRRLKRRSIGKPIGDPPAPISSGAPQARTVRAAVGPPLLRPTIPLTLAGPLSLSLSLGFPFFVSKVFVFTFFGFGFGL